MATYTARLDFGAVLATPDRCPECGHRGLHAVPGTEAPLLRCPECGDCWRFVQGRFFPADRECQDR